MYFSENNLNKPDTCPQLAVRQRYGITFHLGFNKSIILQLFLLTLLFINLAVILK